MSNLDEFSKRLASRIAAAKKEPHWSLDESNEYMASFGAKREQFEKLATQWIEAVILPRVQLVASQFGAKPADNAPPERCLCWFPHSKRFPATVRIEFAVEHDARFKNVVVSCDVSMMPVFIKFNEQDRLTVTLHSATDEDVAAWTEKRLLEFLDIYLQIDQGEQTGEEALATDPVCGMRISRSKAELKGDYKGHSYFFCSPECQQKFRENPREFVRVATM